MANLGFESLPKADALGFLAPQGQPPLAIGDLPHYVDLLHVTAAPPFFSTTEQILNGGPTPDGERQLPGVNGFRGLLERQDQLQVVTGRDGLASAKRDYKTAIVMGLQQTPEDADPQNLTRLYNAGVRVMALAYAKPSRFGSGFLDPEGGMTDEGRSLLESMTAAGIILDLSHSNEQTAQDALRFINRENLALPVMASHGGIRELYRGDRNTVNSRRNLTAATLDEIVGLGGVVGIYALTFGLSDNDNSETPFVEQLQAAAELFPNHVVVGSDATYATRTEEEWRKTFEFMTRNVAAGTDMEPRYPDTPLELNTPARLELIGQKLVAGGMTREKAAQIVGGTLISFVERNLAPTV